MVEEKHGRIIKIDMWKLLSRAEMPKAENVMSDTL